MSPPLERPRLCADVQCRQLSGSTYLIIRPDSGRWRLVNRTGAEVASLCTGEQTVAEICARISAKYQRDYPEENARRFLNSLSDAALLMPDGGSLEAARHPARRRPFHALYLQTTGRCNARCIYCALDCGDRQTDVLTTEDTLRLVDQMVVSGGRRIVLSGGEPLLRADIFDIMRHVKGRGLQLRVTTNGWLLDPGAAREFARHADCATLSMDATDPVIHDELRGGGSHQAACAALQNLIAAGMAGKTVLSMTVTRLNIHAITDVTEFAAAQGLAGVNISGVFSRGRAPAQWARIGLSDDDRMRVFETVWKETERWGDALRISADVCSEYRKILLGHSPKAGAASGEDYLPGCDAGGYLLVDWRGDVYPCPGMDGLQTFRMGNIRESSLPDILAGARWRDIQKELVSRDELKGQGLANCRACTWRYFCGAGCVAAAYLSHGTTSAVDELNCRIKRQNLERAMLSLASLSTPEAAPPHAAMPS